MMNLARILAIRADVAFLEHAFYDEQVMLKAVEKDLLSEVERLSDQSKQRTVAKPTLSVPV